MKHENFQGIQFFRAFIFVVGLCFFHGCSSQSRQIEAPGGGKRIPLNVEVVDASIDEQQELSVIVGLDTAVAFATERVSVSLHGLKDGVIQSSHQRLLSEVFSSDKFRPGDRTKVTLHIPSHGINEYQVKCSWGDEVVEVPMPERYTLKDVRFEKRGLSCDTAPCESVYIVEAQLLNNTAQLISAPQIAVGFTWADQGATPLVPESGSPLKENEEVVTLTGFEILPHQSRALRITIDRPVPTISGGAFHPHVRVITQ